MNFEWNDDEQDMQRCQTAFNELAMGEAIFMTHYELAAETGIPADVWKRFLQHHAVKEWMTGELNLFKEAQMKKLIRKSTTESKSVGTAQMLNALGKTMEDVTRKDGPAFIYCYIPLNKEEMFAPNVVVLDRDIFMEEEEEDEAPA